MERLTEDMCDQLIDLINVMKTKKESKDRKHRENASLQPRQPQNKLENQLDSSDSSEGNEGKALNTQPSSEKKKLNQHKNPYWRPNINISKNCSYGNSVRSQGMIPKRQFGNNKPWFYNADDGRLSDRVHKRNDDFDRGSVTSEQGSDVRVPGKNLMSQIKGHSSSLIDLPSARQKGNVANASPNQGYKRFLPFYYFVPENPLDVNPLPPGKYLVIPQARIVNTPLAVCNHPSAGTGTGGNASSNLGRDESSSSARDETLKDSKTSNNAIGDCGDQQVSQSKKKKKNKKSSSQPTSGRSGGDLADEPRNREADVFDLISGVSLTYEEGTESLLSSSNLAGSHKNQESDIWEHLPFYDRLTVSRLWSLKQKDQDKDSFIQEERCKRLQEVKRKVLDKLPNIDLNYLEEKLPEIMMSDRLVEDFISEEVDRQQHQTLIRLLEEFPDFDFPFVADAYELLKGDVELIKEHLHKERKRRREEAKFERLTAEIYSILPDADPAYISERLLEMRDDPERLNDFIAQLLETQGYPKAPEIDPKVREKRKLWNYYVSEFSVANYLEKVPNPVEAFCGANLKNNEAYRDAVITFLTDRYPDLDNFQLNHAFDENKHSISDTCSLLDRNYLPVKNIQTNLRDEDYNEQFLQEVSFVAHKGEILKFLEEEKRLREIEKKRAQEENSFFECCICYDPEVVGLDVVTCPEGHVTCRSCLTEYVRTEFSEGKCVFPCLNESCDEEYTTKTLEKCLKQWLFSKIVMRRAACEIDQAGVSGLEKCPSCDYAYIPAPEDKIFKCENKECLAEICRLCKEKSHIPLACNEIERPRDVLARREIEEAMSNKLIRCCPKCQKSFIKSDGCNKITCSCGALICYLCLALVNDYTHFNGQGGLELWKCPLYSNNDKLHVDDVKQAGLETKERLMKENPKINFFHDPTEL